MFMFTSCGWFFADISRIEAVQNLRYAARAAEEMHHLGFENADRAFLALLEMALSNYPEAGNGLKLYQKILSENRLARQKAGALLVAAAMLGAGESGSGRADLEDTERTSRDGVLFVRGRVLAPGPDGPSPLPFCYQRRGEEFPLMYFPAGPGEPRLKELFALERAADIQAALEREPGFARITFDDLSWEEKTLYAWLLADSARNSHAAVIFKILEDYLYLLARLPGRELSSWAPLRAQAAAYARQATDIVFARALAAPSSDGAGELAALAARLKAAGLEPVFDPSPEDSAALAAKIAAPALAAPSSRTLGPLLQLLKAARDLGAKDLLFHLQNYLMDLFTAAGSTAYDGGAAAVLHELYSLSGIIIERFNSRLEELAGKG